MLNGDATRPFDATAPPLSATTPIFDGTSRPSYAPLTGGIEAVPDGSPPSYELKTTVPASQSKEPATIDAVVPDVRSDGCCTVNVHCCRGQRPSFPTLASAVSCMCFLVHLPLLYVVNDGGDYTENVGIQQMLAHCVMIVTFLVHSIRFNCGKSRRPAGAKAFVCHCVLFALHLYNALVSVFAQSPDLPYGDVHSERAINLVLMVLSLVAAGFHLLAIHSLYAVATAERGSHTVGFLWQDSALAYGLLIAVFVETKPSCNRLKESLIPLVLAVAFICCVPPVVWSLMGRRHAKTELILTTLIFFSTAIPGIHALIVCGGGRSQSNAYAPYGLPLVVYVTTMLVVGRHLVYQIRYAKVSQIG